MARQLKKRDKRLQRYYDLQSRLEGGHRSNQGGRPMKRRPESASVHQDRA